MDQSDSARLLDADEKSYFSDGLYRYYQHVLSLFEKVKAHSHVVDFADLALQSLLAAGNKVSITPTTLRSPTLAQTDG